MPRNRKWILATTALAVVAALIAGAFYTGYCFGERYAGRDDQRRCLRG